MSERTWSDIGNEIRDDYLRDDGPENINFREVQWDLWVAAIEREAAARALIEAAESFEATTHAWGKLAMIEHLRALAEKEGARNG